MKDLLLRRSQVWIPMASRRSWCMLECGKDLKIFWYQGLDLPLLLRG